MLTINLIDGDDLPGDSTVSTLCLKDDVFIFEKEQELE